MLAQFAAQRPNDPFPRYGLAMELKKLGRLAEANQAFAELLDRHPGYIPAYLMAGNALAEAGDAAAAIAVLERGVAAATAAGDDHARGELEGALAALR
ncbi:MAG: hypothetical protein H6710_17920 [Myxococcales bacterium]|nr:hypothetical protein [Myxococcales bacterium]MCB9701322.1 hypothetical protein [Myxococcales bacterium]